MFGTDKATNNTQKKAGMQNMKDLGVTILTSGCQFTGKLFCKGITRIGGILEGQIIADGLLVIEESAEIVGEVHATELVVHGTIEGSVNSKSRIELCPSAVVGADLTCPKLIIHEGAVFNGKTTMVKGADVRNHDSVSSLQNVKNISDRKDFDQRIDIDAAQPAGKMPDVMVQKNVL